MTCRLAGASVLYTLLGLLQLAAALLVLIAPYKVHVLLITLPVWRQGREKERQGVKSWHRASSVHPAGAGHPRLADVHCCRPALLCWCALGQLASQS